MDEGGKLVKDPATVDVLCRWANDYHAKYFTGAAPDVHIAIVDDAGGAACFDPTSKTAYIEKAITPFEKFSRIALLHEMVHIALLAKDRDADEKHGDRFTKEVRRLMQAGAYDNLL